MAAAISQIGSPIKRNAIDIVAVSTVATQGASVRERSARMRGSSPSSESWERARAAPANGCKVPENMLSTMNQMAAALPASPNNGAKVGPSTNARSLPSGSDPNVPSHTTGRTAKYTPASKPLASIARGTSLLG